MFSDEVATAICAQIAQGESLRKICEQKGMPTVTTVMRWLADERYVAFREQYARAREESADRYAEDIVDIADQAVGLDAAGVQAARLRVDARKWAAAKLKPKKYGEKLELSGDVGRPLTDDQLNERIAALVAKSGGPFHVGEGGAAPAAGGEGQAPAGE